MLAKIFKFSIDFSVSTLVGFGMGYAMDRMLETTPWMMIVFVFLGMAAGARTIYRALEHGKDVLCD